MVSPNLQVEFDRLHGTREALPIPKDYAPFDQPSFWDEEFDDEPESYPEVWGIVFAVSVAMLVIAFLIVGYALRNIFA